MSYSKIIARTAEKESASEDGVFWYKEYQLFVNDQGTAFLSLRYLSRIGEKIFARVDGRTALFTDPDHTWQQMFQGGTPEEVIAEYMGDADFSKAESLDSRHATAKAEFHARCERSNRRYDAEKRAKAAKEELETFKVDQNRLFQKRHGHKDAKAFAKAQQSTMKRLKPEFDRLKQQAEQSARELEAILAST